MSYQLLVVLSVLLLVCSSFGADRVIRVSPKGPTPDLAQALAAARRPRPAGSRVTIELAEGRYRLAEPLVLTPEDSDMLITSAGDAKVILDGSAVLTGWCEE